MKKIFCISMLTAFLLTGCQGGGQGNNETAGTVSETLSESLTVQETVPEDVGLVQHFSISPDENVWLMFVAEDGGVTFSHREQEDVYFNIDTLSADGDENVTTETMGEFMKGQMEEAGFEILSEERTDIGGESWYSISADLGEGVVMKNIVAVKNGVIYNLILFPGEGAEGDIEAAFATFEFNE